MSWLALRDTQRLEDRAYCMLGIFNVYLDTRYRQGPNEFMRLQLRIIEEWNRDLPFDDTLSAWKSDKVEICGLLAPAPVFFRNAHNIVFDSNLALARGTLSKTFYPMGTELDPAKQITIKNR